MNSYRQNEQVIWPHRICLAYPDHEPYVSQLRHKNLVNHQFVSNRLMMMAVKKMRMLLKKRAPSGKAA